MRIFEKDQTKCAERTVKKERNTEVTDDEAVEEKMKVLLFLKQESILRELEIDIGNVHIG